MLALFPNCLEIRSLKSIAALVLLPIILTACSTMNINIPAIGAATDGARLPGKVIWHELLTDTPAETQVFYSELFGWEFENLRDEKINYLLIRNQGTLIGGMIDQTRLPTTADISQWVQLLAVSDITAAADLVKSQGGTIFTQPTSLGDRGLISVVADPQGGLFALLETPDGDPEDTEGIPMTGGFLWDELWTKDIDAAADFYSKLAPYQVETKNLGDADNSVSYRVLSSQTQRRAGIRENPIDGLPTIWVNYLRISDEHELNSILSKVESLGGEILVPATERPGGEKIAIIAGPSGAGIALQTWADDRTAIDVEVK
ncbi:MAG: VOC family protein [Halioglobus sp.]